MFTEYEVKRDFTSYEIDVYYLREHACLLCSFYNKIANVHFRIIRICAEQHILSAQGPCYCCGHFADFVFLF